MKRSMIRSLLCISISAMLILGDIGTVFAADDTSEEASYSTQVVEESEDTFGNTNVAADAAEEANEADIAEEVEDSDVANTTKGVEVAEDAAEEADATEESKIISDNSGTVDEDENVSESTIIPEQESSEETKVCLSEEDDARWYYYEQTIYALKGDSVTMTAKIINPEGEEGEEYIAAPENVYTFEWYKSDGENKEEVGTGSSYTIENLSSSDFTKYNNINNKVVYYCELYKDGEWCFAERFMIYDKRYVYHSSNITEYVWENESIVLTAELYDADMNAIDLNDSDFSFEWHYRGEVIGNELSLVVESVEFSDISTDGPLYYCYIYRDGVRIGRTDIYLEYKYYYDYENEYRCETEVLAVNEGEKASMEAQISIASYDKKGNETLKSVNLSDPEYSFKWYAYSEKNRLGNVLGDQRTYTIQSVTADDFCSTEGAIQTYICRIFKSGEEIGKVTYFLKNKAYYYKEKDDIKIYPSEGEQVKLSAEAYDYKQDKWEDADLSTYEFTFKWYKEFEGEWEEEIDGEIEEFVGEIREELTEEKSSYTIQSVSSTNYYDEDNAWVRYICEIYKNGRHVADTMFYIIKCSHEKDKTTTKTATTSSNGKITTICIDCGKTKSSTTIPKIASVTLATTSYTYNGSAKKPTVIVKDSKGNKISSKYYTVKYTDNKNPGKATVQVTFKTCYSGTVKKTFTINPKGTSISSLTAKSKGFVVKWKAQTTQMTGYQVQYSTSSKFSSTKTLTAGKTKTSLTVSSLKASKVYYVRVRTYKTVGGKKYYSAWSTAKKVTTKK
jgi:hypothetical protein